MNETFLGGHFHLAEGGHFQKFTGVIFIWSDGGNLHGFFHAVLYFVEIIDTHHSLFFLFFNLLLKLADGLLYLIVFLDF